MVSCKLTRIHSIHFILSPDTHRPLILRFLISPGRRCKQISQFTSKQMRLKLECTAIKEDIKVGSRRLFSCDFGLTFDLACDLRILQVAVSTIETVSQIDPREDPDEAGDVERLKNTWGRCCRPPGQGLNLTAAYQRRDNPAASCLTRGGGGGLARHCASPVRPQTSEVKTWDWRHWHK